MCYAHNTEKHKMLFPVWLLIHVSFVVSALGRTLEHDKGQELKFRPHSKGTRLIPHTLGKKNNSDVFHQSGSESQNRDICDQYDVNGCSIPFGAPFFFKGLFTRSCYRHDVCYDCGMRYGFDRKDCDYAFKNNMEISCDFKYFGQESDTRLLGHKQVVLKTVKNLNEEFHDILHQEMAPVLTAGSEKNLQLFQTHAKSVHKSVINKWMEKLLDQLSARNEDRKAMSMVLESAFKIVEQMESKDDKLTTTLCDNPLIQKTEKGIGFSCKDVELLFCRFFKYMYFLAVRVFAEPFFFNTPEFFCGQDFVRKCLLPLSH